MLAQASLQRVPFCPTTTEETYAALLLGLFAFCAGMVVVLRIWLSSQPWGPWVLFIIAQTFVVWMWRVRINKRCPFPAHGPAILIANHRSPVDPWLLCTNSHLGPEKQMFRMVSFLMAEEYYHIPVVAWVCKTMDCIPIARKGRDMSGVKDCLKKLQEGKLIGIFPEGRINQGEGLLPFGTGIAWLALKAQVPVYPVFIHNSPVGDSMVAPFITPSRASLTYGDPIDLFIDEPRVHCEELAGFN